MGLSDKQKLKLAIETLRENKFRDNIWCAGKRARAALKGIECTDY